MKTKLIKILLTEKPQSYELGHAEEMKEQEFNVLIAGQNEITVSYENAFN